MNTDWWKDAKGTQPAAPSRHAYQFALERGVDVARAFDAFGLSPEALEPPDARVPIGFVLLLLDALSEQVDFVGVELGKAGWHGTAGELLGRHCDTFGETLVMARRYRRLHADGISMQPRIEPGRVTLQARFPVENVPDVPARVLCAAVDWWWAGLVSFGRRATGTHWSPLAVHFVYPRPHRTEPIEEHFGCPLSFGSPQNALVVDQRVLELPLVARDPALLRALRPYLDNLLGDLPGERWLDEVRATIGRQMMAGPPNPDTLAKALGLSRRTLQRRLRHQRLSFSELVDDERRELSARLVGEGQKSFAEIAAALGYSSVRAFSRAFARWHGCSPTAYRK